MNVLGYTCKQLSEYLKKKYGKGDYHAQAVYRQIFQRGQKNFAELPEFSKSSALAEKLEQDIKLELPKIINTQESEEVIKLAIELKDGLQIEAVVIPMHSYATLCISSQVGCRMGCKFCATAKMGLKRNLEASEIISQIYLARFKLNYNIRNIVFMGMGEPLDNFDNVVQAIKILNAQRGFDIPLARITLSTCGKVESLNKLSSLKLNPLRIAISLNACNDSLRNQIMPINKKHNLADLKNALKNYPLGPSEVFFIEYVLLKGVNDSPEHCQQLADYVRELPVRVNLIGYNPGHKSSYGQPSDQDLQNFADQLRKQKIFVRIRWSKGLKIMAGCGQLSKN